MTLDGEEYGWAKDSYKATAVQRACERALQRLEGLTGNNSTISGTSSDDEGPQPETVAGAVPARSGASGGGPFGGTPSEEQSALSRLILQFEADTGLFSMGRTPPAKGQ